MSRVLRILIFVVSIAPIWNQSANAQGPLIPAEAEAAVAVAPAVALALRSFAPEVAAALRATITGTARTAFGIETRAAVTTALARGFVFSTIPRVAGQRFIIVVNQTKFEAALKVSAGATLTIPILLSGDSAAAIPNHFTQAIGDRCPGGWATLEYSGKDSKNETFIIACGA